MIDNSAEAQEVLAEYKDIEVLWGALYAALEAEFSSMGWPEQTQRVLRNGAKEIEFVIDVLNLLKKSRQNE